MRLLGLRGVWGWGVNKNTNHETVWLKCDAYGLENSICRPTALIHMCHDEAGVGLLKGREI